MIRPAPALGGRAARSQAAVLRRGFDTLRGRCRDLADRPNLRQPVQQLCVELSGLTGQTAEHHFIPTSTVPREQKPERYSGRHDERCVDIAPWRFLAIQGLLADDTK